MADGRVRESLGRDGHEGHVARGLTAAMRHHVGRFFGRARNFIREAIVAGALALAGPTGLDADDLDETKRQAAAQVAYLDRFESEVVHARTPEPLAESGEALVNPMTAAQFAARVEMYGGAVHGTTQRVIRDKMRRLGVFVAERRVHRKPLSEHLYCKTCIEESRKGWQPLGTLREIGDSECGIAACDCYFVWKDAAGKEYLSPPGRHNPKGYAA